MSDWADEKAREFLQFVEPYSHDDREELESLAALLRAVSVETLVRCCVCEDASAPRPDCECVICSKARYKAEVRRVIAEADEKFDEASSWCFVRDDILARLRRL